ncbi:50S ribosomal protein L20 [Candidatus Marinimicrobia bacterium MT.SAG.3]|nr:50S ribosomal protein L20 [Candidatus Marinimicrobia bacterium MT.SAG.3]TFB13010.1 50S ribosomal protein L20 [Candidatus Marinimicrobia bacterium MT.SAG.4]
MPRTTNAVARKSRHKKILKAAKGYRGGRSKLYKTAKESVDKALMYSYRDRKKRKGDFRRLWIVRINAAARLNGLSYSNFIAGMNAAGIILDRKVLSDIAVNDSEAFSLISEKVKKAS